MSPDPGLEVEEPPSAPQQVLIVLGPEARGSLRHLWDPRTLGPLGSTLPPTHTRDSLELGSALPAHPLLSPEGFILL